MTEPTGIPQPTIDVEDEDRPVVIEITVVLEGFAESIGDGFNRAMELQEELAALLGDKFEDLRVKLMQPTCAEYTPKDSDG